MRRRLSLLQAGLDDEPGADLSVGQFELRVTEGLGQRDGNHEPWKSAIDILPLDAPEYIAARVEGAVQ